MLLRDEACRNRPSTALQGGPRSGRQTDQPPCMRGCPGLANPLPGPGLCIGGGKAGMEKSSHSLHRWKEFTALLTSSSSWCKLYGQMYNLGSCPDFLLFFLIFFLRKRDAKTTLAVPYLVLGFQCWQWKRRNQHSWQVVNVPD